MLWKILVAFSHFFNLNLNNMIAKLKAGQLYHLPGVLGFWGWSQPLAAYPIRCLPDHDQRLAHGIVVNPPPRAGVALLIGLPTSQQPH
jgi:hypothetical protein